MQWIQTDTLLLFAEVPVGTSAWDELVAAVQATQPAEAWAAAQPALYLMFWSLSFSDLHYPAAMCAFCSVVVWITMRCSWCIRGTSAPPCKVSDKAAGQQQQQQQQLAGTMLDLLMLCVQQLLVLQVQERAVAPDG